MPSVASSILDHAITCFEKNLNSIIQFEMYFPRDDDVEVHSVGSVHARMIQFQNINHPRQLLLNFFESGGCAYLIDARPRIWRYSEKAESEAICWREIARVRRCSSIARKFWDGIASP